MRRMSLVAAIAAATLLGPAVPAQAGDLTAGCTVGARRLSAWAYYWPDGTRRWWTGPVRSAR